MTTPETLMTANQMRTAANRINERLRTARKKHPGSHYTNELTRRIIMMTQGLDLIYMSPDGPQLTRSKSKWAKVPEGLAYGILEEILALGSVQMVEERSRELLVESNIEDSKENIDKLMNLQMDVMMTKSKIWEMAYKMRAHNQTLYDLFGEMFGKRRADIPYTDEEIEDILLHEIIYGETDDIRRPSYGPNYRNMEKSNAWRSFLRYYHNAPTYDMKEFEDYIRPIAEAEYGTTVNGVYTPALYEDLTPEQVEDIILKAVGQPW